jgi:hypothetical protein
LKVRPLLAQLEDHSALKVRPLLSGFLGFQAFSPPRCLGAVGEVRDRQRGGENAEENLSPERGVFCIFAHDSAVPKMWEGL